MPSKKLSEIFEKFKLADVIIGIMTGRSMSEVRENAVVFDAQYKEYIINSMESVMRSEAVKYHSKEINEFLNKFFNDSQ